MYDSTHFTNQNGYSTIYWYVTAEFKLVDWEGGVTTRTLSHVVSVAASNRASLFGRHDFEITGVAGQKGMPTVRDACLAMHIGIDSYENDPGWKTQDFLNSLMGDQNVVYIHTHGAMDGPAPAPPLPSPNPPDTWIQSDADEGSGTPTQAELYIYPADILPVIQARIGTGGLPPYNPSGHPPINLAFNDGCWTGNDNAFAEAYLWPYQNAYGGWCEDQSWLGWSVAKTSDQTKPCMEAFWNNMASGWTADYARLRLYDAYQGANKPPGSRNLVHIFGDWDTRLHYVYTGSDGLESRWYFDLL